MQRERGREGGKRGGKIEEGEGGRNGVGRKRGEKKRRGGKEIKEENASCIFCMSCLPYSQHKWAVSPWDLEYSFSLF